MDTSPLISIVVPLFNAVEFIGQTIESAMAQSYAFKEIIVVDDGSTDGSSEMVGKYGRDIRYQRVENGGVARARNRGIAMAKGLFVALLDHDDLWDPTKLTKQIALCVNQPSIGLVLTDVLHIDHEGKPTGEIGLGYDPGNPFAKLFVKGFIPTPSSVLIRRSILDRVGMFNERFHSAGLDDHELWPRIADCCELACVPEPLTIHRDLAPKKPEIALAHRNILTDILLQRYHGDTERKRFLLKERAAYFSDLGKYQLLHKDYSGGMSSLGKALSLSLGPAKSWKTAWRSLSRMGRFWLQG